MDGNFRVCEYFFLSIALLAWRQLRRFRFPHIRPARVYERCAISMQILEKEEIQYTHGADRYFGL